MKQLGLLLILVLSISCMHYKKHNNTTIDVQKDEPTLKPADLESYSQEFFLALRTDSPYEAYVDTIERIDLNYLETSLNTQEKKLAFWINTYNALVQVKLKESPESFKNIKQFFRNKDLLIGGESISLDDLENGILRLQPINEAAAFCIRFRLSTLDYRIHFTLNCGASSCPAIAYYDSKQIEDQLSLAEEVFVQNNSSYDQIKNELTISELFKWFESDFGGFKGIIQIMEKHKVLTKGIQPKVLYDQYDWGISAGKYD